MIDSPLVEPVRVTGPPVCAVVVTPGDSPFLRATLEALAAQTRRADQIVVVDVGGEHRSGDDGAPRPVAEVVAGALPERPDVQIVTANGARSFSHAVTLGLAGSPRPVAPGWLWLLHDDSAPEPEALAQLVRAVEGAPSVGVAGCKQRTWSDPVRLLEVGFTTSGTGRRMPGVEVGEADQGQYDGREDVLAVGMAGALVRRDVWTDLRGADDALGPFGDGLDLCRRARLAGHRVIVVPSAVVRHAQAAFQGLRDGVPGVTLAVGDALPGSADPTTSYAARRRSRVHSRLTGTPLVALPVVSILVVVSGIVWFFVRVTGKDLRLAVAELTAVAGAFSRPVAVARARRRAHATARFPRRSLGALQAGWREVLAEVTDRRLAHAELRRAERAPSELEINELAALAARRRVTLAALVVLLAAATIVVMGRQVVGVISGSSLAGPALLQVDSSAGDLWRAATSLWVDGSLGAYGPADPLLAALLPASALVGGARAVVAGLLLGGVLLAGLGAWFAAGAATRSTALRMWAAIVWAVAPTLVMSVGQGRLGAVLAHAALPWVALGVARALGIERRDVVRPGAATEPVPMDAEPEADDAEQVEIAEQVDPVDAVVPARAAALAVPPSRGGSITAAAAAGIALALVAAGAPVLGAAGLLCLLVVAAVAPRGRRRLLVVTCAPVLALFGPTISAAVSAGGAGAVRLLLSDPGRPSVSTSAPAWQQLLGLPAHDATFTLTGVGGRLAEALPLVLGAVVLALAAVALLRGRGAARGVRAGWLVAFIGLAAAAASSRVEVAVADGRLVRGWPGAGVSLALLGLLVAAVVGADGLRERMARRTFGWRQAAVGLMTVLAVIGPVVGAGVWVAASLDGGPRLQLLDHRVVPAVGQQAQRSVDRSRVLALAVDEHGAMSWQLLRGDGPQLTERASAVAAQELVGPLGHAVQQKADAVTSQVETLVTGLARGAVPDAAGELSAFAVSDVLVPPIPGARVLAADSPHAARRAELVARLDATAGLERITENESGVVWRVTAPTGGTPVVTAWARLVTPASGATAAVESGVAARADGVSTVVEPGPQGRLLVLSERSDAGWSATLDGTPLRAVGADWRQTFEVGASGGRLEVSYESPDRVPWLALQGAVWLLVLLLAVPLRRRRTGHS